MPFFSVRRSELWWGFLSSFPSFFHSLFARKILDRRRHTLGNKKINGGDGEKLGKIASSKEKRILPAGVLEKMQYISFFFSAPPSPLMVKWPSLSRSGKKTQTRVARMMGRGKKSNLNDPSGTRTRESSFSLYLFFLFIISHRVWEEPSKCRSKLNFLERPHYCFVCSSGQKSPFFRKFRSH